MEDAMSRTVTITCDECGHVITLQVPPVKGEFAHCLCPGTRWSLASAKYGIAMGVSGFDPEARTDTAS